MALDQFLDLDGIEGESTDKVHKGKIDVLAWSFGGSQASSGHVGGGSGAGKSTFTPMSITKYLDKSTHRLLGAMAVGDHIKKGTLIVRKAGGKAPIEYYKVEMEEILVTNVSQGGSGGEDRLTENIALEFAKFKVTYQPQKQDGTKDGGELITAYDIAANAAES